MQPYPNPNYYQNYMQPQQQFYNQPAVVQQYQQPSYMQQAAQRINGRVVQSADMITANDVPMDGSVAFFPVTRTEVVRKGIENVLDKEKE